MAHVRVASGAVPCRNGRPYARRGGAKVEFQHLRRTLIHTDIISTGLLSVTALTAGFFAYLYTTKRQGYLLAWTGGWCLLLLHTFTLSLESNLGTPAWLVIPDVWSLAAATLLFFQAVQMYLHARPNLLRLLGAAAVFAVWSAAYALGVTRVGPQIGATAVLLGIAWLFWQEGRRQEIHGKKLLSVAFIIWALFPAVAAYLTPGNPNRMEFAVLSRVPGLFVALLMGVMVFEEESRRIERDVIALSNLNLASLSFLGSEMDKTLAQVLESVLRIVRFPAGVFTLRLNSVEGPAVVTSAGMDASAFRAIQQEQGDAELTCLVTKLGGIAVFRDLDRDAAWEPLRGRETFQELRKLAASAGLRTVVGITLQAKGQACGLLLLGTTENHQPSRAELRLLMTLRQQISTAVENSYLMQQTWRRSEELHVLNEIGRALSSMLDPDALFEKIFAEIQRLFDGASFYVALYDAADSQVRLELEMVDGVRLAKRARPMGNHLTECILRSRQPILIRENFEEETRKLGVESRQRSGSFCGVPLISYDRVIGVMAVRSLEERRFDEGHTEMMRVLGSEASIAIENARLFHEERTKSRHLALLNSISRSAITTLNPEEMLANIAAQLEKGLAFDHIGIGLLDYVKKEVVIQAESGRRRGARGRRLELGETLVGRVARTGQTCTIRDFAKDGWSEPVLAGSTSGIALPIVYAEQLHGVLYVETERPVDFSEEERLLLHTLADLISGALHNALAFQRAQEQAITDGLTAVKTHRFLMEALSAEWKRSTRANRAFCVLLIDLDRFKFVNDFYGHLEGDMVLKRIAHILEENCRRSDVVARYGGDEFVILMPETTMEQGLQIGETLRSWIASDALLREKRITASFGIAGFPIHGSTPQELIQVADAAMYLSKHQGGNAVSTAENFNPQEASQWKRHVLEAYLGVTVKRMFATGPEALEEIRARIAQFEESLEPATHGTHGSDDPIPPPNKASKGSIIETVKSLAQAIDAKDHFTQGHSQNVSRYAVLMAEVLGLESEEIEEIRTGAVLHDIGKVGIPPHILNKKGPLDPEEWETMKAHTRYADEILAPLRALDRIRDMVRHHHEMFDGSGYPDGLAGEQIPLGARIVCIADAYDTITSDRVYKKAGTLSAACSEIERCAGTQFDPELVRVFVAAMRGRFQQSDSNGSMTARETTSEQGR